MNAGAARRVIVLLQDLAPLTPTPTHLDMRQAVDALHAKIPVPPDIEA